MYLHWDQKTITDFSPENIEALYDQGYVFTRLGKGVMHQTRSARINLSQFEPSSENRRILKKVETLTCTLNPIPYAGYSWEIGKMGKDFYEARDADFSANKIKELVTDPSKSNFNTLLAYHDTNTRIGANDTNDDSAPSAVGYVIGFQTNSIFHYSYPFYSGDSKDVGLGMMLLAIQNSKLKNSNFFYLGSLQRPSDSYKLQFAGLEWFDTERGLDADKTQTVRGKWNTDIEKVKKILSNLPQ